LKNKDSDLITPARWTNMPVVYVLRYGW